MGTVPGQEHDHLNRRIQLALAGVYFCILTIPQLIGGYGIFRDELYYLACAAHPAFGYVDQPPLSIWLLSAVTGIFGDSIVVLRVLSALIGSAVIYFTADITRELGGGKWAQWFTMLAFAAAPGMLVVHGFYSMNALDHLAWTLMVLSVLRIVNNGDPKEWLAFGLIAGLGMQNKYSVAFLIFGLGVGLLLTGRFRIMRSMKFVYGALLGIALFVPHIIWQIVYDWPTKEFIANAQAEKIRAISPIEFIAEIVLMMGPGLILVWGTGLLFLLIAPSMRRYRFIAVSFIAIFILLNVQTSKAYYLMAAYPPLFAAGAVGIQRLVQYGRGQWKRWVAVAWVALGLSIAFPLGTPLLPPPEFASLSRALGIEVASAENSEVGMLPQHFADRFGWPNMVATIAGVYHSLSPEEKATAAIFCSNYGQAGAVDYYGADFELPKSISNHNNYWIWGPPDTQPEVAICIGSSQSDLETLFEVVEARDTVVCTYCIPHENNQPVFVCRGLKYNLSDVWPQLRYFM